MGPHPLHAAWVHHMAHMIWVPTHPLHAARFPTCCTLHGSLPTHSPTRCTSPRQIQTACFPTCCTLHGSLPGHSLTQCTGPHLLHAAWVPTCCNCTLLHPATAPHAVRLPCGRKLLSPTPRTLQCFWRNLHPTLQHPPPVIVACEALKQPSHLLPPCITLAPHRDEPCTSP